MDPNIYANWFEINSWMDPVVFATFATNNAWTLVQGRTYYRVRHAGAMATNRKLEMRQRIIDHLTDTQTNVISGIHAAATRLQHFVVTGSNENHPLDLPTGPGPIHPIVPAPIAPIAPIVPSGISVLSTLFARAVGQQNFSSFLVATGNNYDVTIPPAALPEVLWLHANVDLIFGTTLLVGDLILCICSPTANAMFNCTQLGAAFYVVYQVSNLSLGKVHLHFIANNAAALPVGFVSPASIEVDLPMRLLKCARDLEAQFKASYILLQPPAVKLPTEEKSVVDKWTGKLIYYLSKEGLLDKLKDSLPMRRLMSENIIKLISSSGYEFKLSSSFTTLHQFCIGAVSGSVINRTAALSFHPKCGAFVHISSLEVSKTSAFFEQLFTSGWTRLGLDSTQFSFSLLQFTSLRFDGSLIEQRLCLSNALDNLSRYLVCFVNDVFEDIFATEMVNVTLGEHAHNCWSPDYILFSYHIALEQFFSRIRSLTSRDYNDVFKVDVNTAVGIKSILLLEFDSVQLTLKDQEAFRRISTQGFSTPPKFSPTASINLSSSVSPPPSLVHPHLPAAAIVTVPPTRTHCLFGFLEALGITNPKYDKPFVCKFSKRKDKKNKCKFVHLEKDAPRAVYSTVFAELQDAINAELHPTIIQKIAKRH